MSMTERIGSVAHSGFDVRVRLIVPAAALLASLCFGGGTRAGFLADAVLQALAIPLLLIALHHWLPCDPGQAGARDVRYAIWLWCAFIGLFLLQLVPMPPELWSMLPARQSIVSSLQLAGREQPWLPLSVAPDATWLALLSLIPPLTVFVATQQASHADRRRLVSIVIAFIAFSAFLGLLQFAQGQASPLRPFDYTNRFEAVGLFANRNHFAALIYSGLILAAVTTAVAAERLASTPLSRAEKSRNVASVLTGFSVIVLLTCAIVMARSRAGLGLMMLAVLGSFAITAALPWRHSRRWGRHWFALAGVGLAMLLAGELMLLRLLERFVVDPGADGRIAFAQNTIEAAIAFMPLGSGIGTFVPVYATYEKLIDAYAGYANRAHNDYLEAWLETGVPGCVLLALFAVWLVRCGIAVWGRTTLTSRRDEALLARASFVIILLIMAHSLVDYPLRTAAIASLFAFCCALLLPVPDAVERETGSSCSDPQQQHSMPAGRTDLYVLSGSTGRAITAGEDGRRDWLEHVAAVSSNREEGHSGQLNGKSKPGRAWLDEANWPDEWRSTTSPAKPPTRNT